MAPVIRLLILHRQLSFSLRMKETLEQLGGFSVTAFTTLETAYDHLQTQSYHVALVDFMLPGVSGLDAVLRLRSVHPELAIIASPNVPEVAVVVNQMGLSGTIDTPCSARDLLPLLRSTLRELTEILPDTAEAPILSDTDTLSMEQGADDSMLLRTQSSIISNEEEAADPERAERHSKTIEFVLKADIQTLDTDELPEGLSERSAQLFQQLAKEEPPMPTLTESGTIHDLHVAASQTDSREVAAAMLPQPIVPRLTSGEDDEEIPTDNVPVKMALRSAIDESLTLDELKGSIQQQFPDTQGIQPLPSWSRRTQSYTGEPDFLDEVDTSIIEPVNEPPTKTDELLGQAPVVDSQPLDLPEMPSKKSTAELPPYDFDSRPVDLPEQDMPTPVDQTGELDEAEQAELEEDFEALQEKQAAAMPSFGTDRITIGIDSEDPQIAQLALSLTQYSLELTAEATILARGGEIIAYAGLLPVEEIEEVNGTILEDWEAEPGEARIRFVNLPSSGQDYMIYSRRTDDDLTLSLVFAGNLPLRVMRRQSERLLTALDTIPERDPDTSLLDELQERELQNLEMLAAQEVESALQSSSEIARDHGQEYAIVSFDQPIEIPDLEIDIAYAGALTAYTFIWVLRDPNARLTEPAMQAIYYELERQLGELGWQVENLQVYEDFVYLIADVPGEASSHAIITDIRHRSAWIAYAVDKSIEPDTLWADGYCVLTPGREMEMEEIQYFINFARMG